MQRFWEKVVKDKSDCWLWTACKHPDGYGHFRLDNTRSLCAHRVAWELVIGPIPEKLHVLHKCDVRECVNPSHLFLGTNLDNIADRTRKGRSALHAGEDNGRARLTKNDVIAIRQSSETLHALATKYQVDFTTIWKARAGLSWKSIK